ncbi:hypothetical protein C5167_035445 [Papaver somniferum]|uniref:Uncharacterized protein n=1 Tax=Papaver somniferum TaxID=3469 RepID=A0A4Y7KFW8_PAPSO|nr:hypothetical protein C5167_035445 [Papaver somniferum]
MAKNSTSGGEGGEGNQAHPGTNTSEETKESTQSFQTADADEEIPGGGSESQSDNTVVKLLQDMLELIEAQIEDVISSGKPGLEELKLLRSLNRRVLEGFTSKFGFDSNKVVIPLEEILRMSLEYKIIKERLAVYEQKLENIGSGVQALRDESTARNILKQQFKLEA